LEFFSGISCHIPLLSAQDEETILSKLEASSVVAGSGTEAVSRWIV